VAPPDQLLVISNLSAPYTINLPASPLLGDEYTVKDASGSVGIYTVTLNGNGHSIDGATSINFNSPYFTITVNYNGSSWSVIA
jgi:hypothetical protein